MCGSEISARQAIEKVIEVAGRDANGWWVLNTIPLREDRNSDADVVVGIPGAGLLILEVKGWTSFSVDDAGRWSRPGPGGVRTDAKDGPFEQARRQEYLLKQLIERCMREQALATGAIPRVGSGVVFGNLTSQKQIRVVGRTIPDLFSFVTRCVPVRSHHTMRQFASSDDSRLSFLQIRHHLERSITGFGGLSRSSSFLTLGVA